MKKITIEEFAEKVLDMRNAQETYEAWQSQPLVNVKSLEKNKDKLEDEVDEMIEKILLDKK